MFASQRILPAERTLSALRNLSPDATLADVFKITGEASMDIGSALHNFSFRLDDHSFLVVRAQVDGRLVSIEHSKTTLTKLFPKQ